MIEVVVVIVTNNIIVRDLSTAVSSIVVVFPKTIYRYVLSIIFMNINGNTHRFIIFVTPAFT